jgi:hypothetical protein
MSSVKKLSFQNIEELNSRIQTPAKAPAASLLKSAPKVLSAAKDADKLMDEELVNFAT